MAVYTDVSDEDLERFLSQFPVGTLVSFKGIAEGVENSNYLIATDDRNYILTLYERRVAENDLPFFLGLIDHLAAKGLSCPTPVRTHSGEVLSRLAGRPAALVTFLDGIWVRRPKAEHCHALGRAMAELHLAGADFAMTRPNALGVDGWRPLFETFADDADQVRPALGGQIEAELSTLEEAWPRDLASGVIHADLFPDNVFFKSGELSGLIDFYFACNDAFAYDLAVSVNAWCFETDLSFNVTKARAMFDGYQSVRQLTDAERQAMPTLARGAALRFLLTRAHDWIHTPKDALVKPHDPIPFLRRLWTHREMTSAADYGLAAAP
ncbi:MAG: homoserine kinase [Pseudomonadota bacterium]